MPEPKTITKALLQEIEWDNNGKVKKEGTAFPVQFNPESLKVSFSNQVAGGNQAGGSAIQFAGKGTTKLTFDLWFDVTDPNIDDTYKNITDVRRITKKVADFMQTTQTGTGKKAKYVPPGVRFLWGTFLFEGVMESINETLEFFSDQGKPLRASVSVSLTKQDVDVNFGKDQNASAGGKAPGTQSLTQAQQGDTAQGIAARNGNTEKWPDMARANNIENPRRIPMGTPIRPY